MASGPAHDEAHGSSHMAGRDRQSGSKGGLLLGPALTCQQRARVGTCSCCLENCRQCLHPSAFCLTSPCVLPPQNHPAGPSREGSAEATDTSTWHRRGGEMQWVTVRPIILLAAGCSWQGNLSGLEIFCGAVTIRLADRRGSTGGAEAPAASRKAAHGCTFVVEGKGMNSCPSFCPGCTSRKGGNRRKQWQNELGREPCMNMEVGRARHAEQQEKRLGGQVGPQSTHRPSPRRIIVAEVSKDAAGEVKHL